MISLMTVSTDTEIIILMNYLFKGGIRLDMIRATWPFAKLEISENDIKISSPVGSFCLDKSQIVQINSVQGFLSQGIRIYHTDPKAPFLIIFWSFSPEEIIEASQKNQYPYSYEGERSWF